MYDADHLWSRLYECLGVALVNGNNNTVRGNTIFNSDEAAVFVDGNSNRITDNTFNEAPIGILVGGGTNNQISGNRYFNIGMRVVPPSASSNSSLGAQQATEPKGLKVNPTRP